MSTPTVKNVSKDYRELDGYESFADWIGDVENNVYIGTNAAKYAQSPIPESKWVMPIHVSDSLGAHKSFMMEKILPIYEKWVRGNAFLMNSLGELKGKNLGCWCFPKPCHGTVLVKLYQEIYEKPSGEKKKKN